ncbi:hypothetical protein GBF38_012651, partial [Nibea albiflora]
AFFFFNFQLKYILDTDSPAGELIVKTGKSCLTRADFWGLGLNKEMESTTDASIRDAIVIPVWKPGHFLLSKPIAVTKSWQLDRENWTTNSDGHATFATVVVNHTLGPWKDLVEDRVLRDCRHAAEWVEANNPLFSAKVDLPDVLDMGRKNRQRLLCNMGGCGKKNWMTMKEQSLSHSSLLFTTLMTCAFFVRK